MSELAAFRQLKKLAEQIHAIEALKGDADFRKEIEFKTELCTLPAEYDYRLPIGNTPSASGRFRSLLEGGRQKETRRRTPGFFIGKLLPIASAPRYPTPDSPATNSVQSTAESPAPHDASIHPDQTPDHSPWHQPKPGFR